MSVKILLIGSEGRMGKAIQSIAPEYGIEVVAAIDIGQNPADHIASCDVVVDFSHKTVTADIVKLAAQHRKPIVIGTTGHSEEERKDILKHASEIPMVWSGNYSLGVNLLFYLTSKAAAALPSEYEPEIVEIHHHFKKDAPSGTAEDLARRICAAREWDIGKNKINGRSGMPGERPQAEIGVHALRGGDVVGEHTVYFFGQGERIEIKHTATDRNILAKGAIKATQWIAGREPGFYEMQDILGLR